MAYRNKVYICFDADTDMKWYNLMKAWEANDAIDFDFNNAHGLNNLRDGSSEETIKRKLRERMANSKMLVVLIGEKTKNLYKYVRWEIDIALNYYKIPIVCVNLNKLRGYDPNLCPSILKNELAIHVSFEQKIMMYALRNWAEDHAKLIKAGAQGPRVYNKSVYDGLGMK